MGVSSAESEATSQGTAMPRRPEEAAGEETAEAASIAEAPDTSRATVLRRIQGSENPQTII